MSGMGNNDGYNAPGFQQMLKAGYEEMATLNVRLSEEGLYQDIRNLENYEIYLVESECFDSKER